MKKYQKKICIITSGRADYGLLKNLIKKISSSKKINYHLSVTGTHLSLKHGNTLNEILSDKLKVNSRIKILGEDQNNSLEKKIFLQIIDFSWRSHLQYLEQLRQVIGLRQYGQKDPLSEFKKEAFVLFEGLLLKIKNDLIKFLLNLNIVVSNDEKGENKQEEIRKSKSEKKVGRNEKCPCGSGKKFKHCHGAL